MLTQKLVRTSKVLIAVSLVGSVFLPARAATPGPVSTQAIKALATQSISAAAVDKWQHANCGAYYYVAPLRHQTIVLGHSANLKSRDLKKHISDLTPSSAVASTDRQKQVSWQIPEPLNESLDIASTCFEPVAYSTIVDTARIIKHPFGPALSWQICLSKIRNENDGKIYMDDGEAIFSATRDMSVRIGEVDARFGKGSIILLRQRDGITRIVDLHDTRRDAVAVQIGVKPLYLKPGQEMLIGNNDESIKNCKRRDGSIRRFSKITAFPESRLAAGLCEISVPLLLKYHPILSQLYKSPDKVEHSIAEKVLKMSACLAHVARSYEPYTQDN